MVEKIAALWPEIALFLTTCVVMLIGLSPSFTTRKLSAWASAAGLVAAFVLALTTGPDRDTHASLLPNLIPFAKATIAAVGLLLLAVLAGTVDRGEEARIASGRGAFEPLRSTRGEFYSFFLFSLTGLMLCATADDLVWLFLALELTSLPTYIMVTISTGGWRSKESGVKYFFLGALGAAIFLYGFALIYGGTGTTFLPEIYRIVSEDGLNPIILGGFVLALVGVCFKIAAVPMHFYTPDVYQGSAAPVAAFLAFVPKTAGFIAILLLTSSLGWRFNGLELGGTDLPGPVYWLLWIVAALTMTAGNVLAVLQTSVKRMLAYSSIAHSGYMLVGVVAGPVGPEFTRNGLGAVLFYLLCYGVMNTGAFAVLASVERRHTLHGEESSEPDTVDDLRGLCATHPLLGWTMVICALSLLGMPPLLGFFGKVPLFTAGVAAQEIPLVVVLGVNSAIAAFYYLRLVSAPLLEKPDPRTEAPTPTPFASRPAAALASAAGVVGLAVLGNGLMRASAHAGAYTPDRVQVLPAYRGPENPPEPVSAE